MCSYGRHLVNTIKQSVLGSDADYCFHYCDNFSVLCQMVEGFNMSILFMLLNNFVYSELQIAWAYCIQNAKLLSFLFLFLGLCDLHVISGVIIEDLSARKFCLCLTELLELLVGD